MKETEIWMIWSLWAVNLGWFCINFVIPPMTLVTNWGKQVYSGRKSFPKAPILARFTKQLSFMMTCLFVSLWYTTHPYFLYLLFNEGLDKFALSVISSSNIHVMSIAYLVFVGFNIKQTPYWMIQFWFWCWQIWSKMVHCLSCFDSVKIVWFPLIFIDIVRNKISCQMHDIWKNC